MALNDDFDAARARLRDKAEYSRMMSWATTTINTQDLLDVIGELDAPLAEVEQLREKLEEHARLHTELNKILHPNGDGPKAPALCDLVAYAEADLRKLRSLALRQHEMLEDVEAEASTVECERVAKMVKALLEEGRALLGKEGE